MIKSSCKFGIHEARLKAQADCYNLLAVLQHNVHSCISSLWPLLVVTIRLLLLWWFCAFRRASCIPNLQLDFIISLLKPILAHFIPYHWWNKGAKPKYSLAITLYGYITVLKCILRLAVVTQNSVLKKCAHKLRKSSDFCLFNRPFHFKL